MGYPFGAGRGISRARIVFKVDRMIRREPLPMIGNGVFKRRMAFAKASAFGRAFAGLEEQLKVPHIGRNGDPDPGVMGKEDKIGQSPEIARRQFIGPIHDKEVRPPFDGTPMNRGVVNPAADDPKHIEDSALKGIQDVRRAMPAAPGLRRLGFGGRRFPALRISDIFLDPTRVIHAVITHFHSLSALGATGG